MDIKYIIILVVVVVIVLILIYFLISSGDKHEFKEGKMVEYSGMFKRVSNLNIGHDRDAPIFHARPYFGNNQFQSGIGEYFGVMKITDKESIQIDFPTTRNKVYYEVNIFDYPSWEQIDNTLINPKSLSIGCSSFDDIKIAQDKEILIIVTGYMNNELMTDWLNKCHVYTGISTEYKNKKLNINYGKKSDISHQDLINQKCEEFVDQFISLNPNYNINIQIISSLSNETSFPPTNGVIETVLYTPKNVDEVLIIVIPNRKLTLDVPEATFLETDDKKLYFQNSSNDVVNIYTYQITTLNDITIEERFPIAMDSSTLPFYVFVASKLT